MIALRGYPDPDPIFYAMPWLWISPILLSAIFDDDQKRRKDLVLLYSLIVTCVIALVMGSGMRPWHFYWMEFFMSCFFIIAFICLINLAVERIFQFFLGKIRRFELTGNCRSCGALYINSINVECPECKAPIDEIVSTSASCPPNLTANPWRIIFVGIGIIILTVAFPFVFRQGFIFETKRGGQVAAERDWASNQAVFYTDNSSLHLQNKYEPVTGLCFRPMSHFYETRLQQKAYQETINRKISEFGPRPIAKYLLTSTEFKKLVKSDKLKQIATFPFKLGPITLSRTEKGTIRINSGGPACDYGTPKSVKYMVLHGKENLIVIALDDDDYYTFGPDGEYLQNYWEEPPSEN